MVLRYAGLPNRSMTCCSNFGLVGRTPTTSEYTIGGGRGRCSPAQNNSMEDQEKYLVPIKLAAKVKPKPRAKKEAEQPALETQAQEIVVETQTREIGAEAPAEESVAIVQVEPAADSKPAPQPKKKKAPAIQPIHEQFDLNLVILAGVIHSVWGRTADVFARIAVSTRGELMEKDDDSTSFVTLRFASGAVDGSPISVQPGDVVRVQGYLTHMDYNESLRKFLDDAHSMDFFDLVAPDDLQAWRSLTLRRHNAVMNVLSLAILDMNGKTVACFGNETKPDDPVNRASVEGIVARVWEYQHGNDVDLYTRLAVYDEHTPVTKREGNFGRARRIAHYITVRFPAGKTSTGSPVRLNNKTRIRVVGELRDKGQVVTLHEELLKTGLPIVAEMMQRVSNADRMSTITAHQESLHVLADALIVYSANGGSRR